MTLFKKGAFVASLVALIATNYCMQASDSVLSEVKPEDTFTSAKPVAPPLKKPRVPPASARCHNGFSYFDKLTEQCHLLWNNKEATQFFETDFIGRLPKAIAARVKLVEKECPNTYIRMYEGLKKMWAGPVPTWVDMYIQGQKEVLPFLHFQWKQRSSWSILGLVRVCSALNDTVFAQDLEELF